MAADSVTVDRRREIVLAAASRFLDRGFTATSLRDIAADCGIKAGSIYYHFDSKEQLLREVLGEGIEAMVAAFDEVAATTAAADAEHRVRAHVAAHLSVLFEQGPVTAAHVGAFRTLPDAVRADLIPSRDRYEQRWADLLSDLQVTGHLDPGLDLTLGRLTLLGAMNFTTEWYDPTRGELSALVDVVVRQFWHGVGWSPTDDAEAAA